MRKKLITDNPFLGIPCQVTENRARFRFVKLEEAARIFDACPNAEWRLLFALARFGGLRCPSETLNLRWQDIDYARRRMIVTSPKTKRHVGHESRTVPLFPELLPHLEAAFDQAAEGAEFCIHRYRSQDANLRSELHRIIRICKRPKSTWIERLSAAQNPAQ